MGFLLSMAALTILGMSLSCFGTHEDTQSDFHRRLPEVSTGSASKPTTTKKRVGEMRKRINDFVDFYTGKRHKDNPEQITIVQPETLVGQVQCTGFKDKRWFTKHGYDSSKKPHDITSFGKGQVCPVNKKKCANGGNGQNALERLLEEREEIHDNKRQVREMDKWQVRLASFLKNDPEAAQVYQTIIASFEKRIIDVVKSSPRLAPIDADARIFRARNVAKREWLQKADAMENYPDYDPELTGSWSPKLSDDEDEILQFPKHSDVLDLLLPEDF